MALWSVSFLFFIQGMWDLLKQELSYKCTIRNGSLKAKKKKATYVCTIKDIMNALANLEQTAFFQDLVLLCTQHRKPRKKSLKKTMCTTLWRHVGLADLRYSYFIPIFTTSVLRFPKLKQYPQCSFKLYLCNYRKSVTSNFLEEENWVSLGVGGLSSTKWTGSLRMFKMHLTFNIGPTIMTKAAIKGISQSFLCECDYTNDKTSIFAFKWEWPQPGVLKYSFISLYVILFGKICSLSSVFNDDTQLIGALFLLSCPQSSTFLCSGGQRSGRMDKKHLQWEHVRRNKANKSSISLNSLSS